MERSGRGLILDGCRFPYWRFVIGESEAGRTGSIRAEGWDESARMAAWFEAVRGKRVWCGLAEGPEVEIVPLGLRTHESGHYSEAAVSIRVV